MRSHVFRILVALIALSGIGVVGRTFRETRPFHYICFAPWQETGQDRFSKMARRYVLLRPHLRGQTSVGWVSSYDHETGQRMMAESMLAPTLVIDSDAPELLIASFEDEEHLDGFLSSGKFSAQQRFGDGVAMLRRRPR